MIVFYIARYSITQLIINQNIIHSFMYEPVTESIDTRFAYLQKIKCINFIFFFFLCYCHEPDLSQEMVKNLKLNYLPALN